MLKFIFLLYLATHMSNAHPGHAPETIASLYGRQNIVISSTISFSTRIISGQVSFSTSTSFLSSTQASSPRPSSVLTSSRSSSSNASRTSNTDASQTLTSNSSPTSTSNPSRTSKSNVSRSSSAGASRSSSSGASRSSSAGASRSSSSKGSRSSSSKGSRSSSAKGSRSSSAKGSRSSSSNGSRAPSERPSTKRSEPSTYPTVNEDSVAPTEAAPVTTTYGPITATVADNPVTLAFSGEVLPLQTAANHKPVSSKFKDSVLAALAKDPETRAFGDLLTQAPSVFEGLEEKQEYYLFAPTTQFVIDFLKHMQENPSRLARRKVLVDPNTSHQFAEKPKGAPDIKRVSTTLKTALKGETKYVDLGASEGARVVSDPESNENGTVYVTSGFGNSTLVHADEIPFDGGIIKKCDGFFTFPHAIETVFANTSGRLWSIALQKADMLTQLSEKRMVTIFAVQDSVLDEANLPGSADLNRLIYDGLSYSPDMSDGSCLPTRGGGSLSIKRNGNDILVNGARISRANVIAKNGVIHYLEKIPPAETCGGSGSGAGVQSDKKSAGSIVIVSRIAVLGLSIASLAVCLWT